MVLWCLGNLVNGSGVCSPTKSPACKTRGQYPEIPLGTVACSLRRAAPVPSIVHYNRRGVTRANLGNCLRASWRKACQDVEDAHRQGLRRLSKHAFGATCKAAATLAFATCVSVGNAICKNP